MRLVGTVAVAAMVAAAVQVGAASVAAAAPVTCVGTAKVFTLPGNGSIWYYEHRAPATGDYSWTNGRVIGSGFTGRTVASADGIVYHVNAAGELRRYRYDGTMWTDGAGTLVGTGWQMWASGQLQLSADAKGRLFAVDNYSNLLMFDQSVSRWDADKGIALDADWFRDELVAAGDGVVYRISDTTGGISRYHYDHDSQRLTRSPEFGTGWYWFDKVFSPGGDVLYAITNGTMYWYRYDADTNTWANGGNGRVVGDGWSGTSWTTATTDTCSVPAPAPVGSATPAGPDSDHPLELYGAGLDFGYAVRDAQGRALELREISDTRISSLPVGQQTFASDLSVATSRDDRDTEALVGLDSTGTAWLSEGEGIFAPDWQPFGKGMTRLALTEAQVPAQPVHAVAVDGDGGLWWRQRVSRTSPTGPARWLAWQRMSNLVADFDSVAGGSDMAYGVTGDQWFTITRNGDGHAFRLGSLPAAGEVDNVIAADTSWISAAVLARNVANGQPYLLRGAGTGFGVAWHALPPLTHDGSVTLADQSMSAAQLSTQQLAVAAVGSDGHVYVTKGDVYTGQFDAWQLVGEPIDGAPQLVTLYFENVQLGYRGQDGKIYRYEAPTLDASPLVFSGGGRTVS